jgi:hypothetical protein
VGRPPPGGAVALLGVRGEFCIRGKYFFNGIWAQEKNNILVGNMLF